MITDKIVKYLAVALLLIALGLASVQTFRLHSAQLDVAEAAGALATAKREAAEKLAQDQAQVRKAENNLQDSAAQTRDQIHEATQSIAAERDALLVRVRLAEATRAKLLAAVSQATAAAGPVEAAPVGDGTQLLATIGSADVDEAARAERIRVALLGCYRDYEAASEALRQLQP